MLDEYVTHYSPTRMHLGLYKRRTETVSQQPPKEIGSAAQRCAIIRVLNEANRAVWHGD